MISLYNTLKESLLGGFDEIEASIDPKKEIVEFIKDNYVTFGKLKISKEPNENGKYVVDCTEAIVNNKNITSLTNNLFEWGEINVRFSCYNCSKLTTLEGAPKKVGGNFNCSFCDSLVSLEGCPKKIGRGFCCNNCNSLTSLKGAPEKVSKDFICSDCDSLTSLEGAPKKVDGCFDCNSCDSLTSLEGAPLKVGVGFYCQGCGKQFTIDDVEKVCNARNIYTK